MDYCEQITKMCAQRTHHALRSHVMGPRILDVGAAEGYMGELLNDDGFDVTLLDMYDANQAGLPHVSYSGLDFPFPDDSFDTTIISLVLHHSEDDERVLQEAIRVTRRRLLIAESVYRTRLGKWILWAADTLFNGVRSGGSMPRALHFKRVEAWRRIFSEHGLAAAEEIDLSRGIHRQVCFVLDCPCPEIELATSFVGSIHMSAGRSAVREMKLIRPALTQATHAAIRTCRERGCQHVE